MVAFYQRKYHRGARGLRPGRGGRPAPPPAPPAPPGRGRSSGASRSLPPRPPAPRGRRSPARPRSAHRHAIPPRSAGARPRTPPPPPPPPGRVSSRDAIAAGALGGVEALVGGANELAHLAFGLAPIAARGDRAGDASLEHCDAEMMVNSLMAALA